MSATSLDTGSTPVVASPWHEVLAKAPKALLHDHLDGGLRPQSVIELANEFGYKKLPTTDVVDLKKWFHRGAKRNDLVLYLETFAHTVGVMQHRDAIERVAFECAQDLANDNVVYAEVRFAPELHTESGLTLDEVVRAVLAGFHRGSAGTDLTIYAILSAMRTAARSHEIAELAVKFRDEGVVGFDIAGAEAGYPPTRHLDAFQFIQRSNFHTTIHAGEAFGLPSIWEALQFCGAERLGHGITKNAVISRAKRIGTANRGNPSKADDMPQRAVKVRALKAEGKSWAEIPTALGLTRKQARHAAEYVPPPPKPQKPKREVKALAQIHAILLGFGSNTPEAKETGFRAIAHARRTAALPPVTETEAERLVREYLARRPATVCPSPCAWEGNLGVTWRRDWV